MENGELETIEEDFNQSELDLLDNFNSNNRPGITKIKDSDVFQWFDLYMHGKTYTEISQISNSKKELILYMSRRAKWYNQKMDHYSDLSSNMLDKCEKSKIDSLNTVVTMVSALNKYFGEKFNKYLKNNDQSIIEGLDTKLLAQYYKATEAMDKIIGGSIHNDEDKPLVNINMTSSARVTQTSKNTLEIDVDETENQKIAGEILANLSKLKKTRTEE